MIHRSLGQQQGLTSAIGYQALFDRFGMVLETEEKADAED